MPRTIIGRRAAGAAGAVGFALAVAACGGSTSTVNGVSGASHDSPEGAVRGYVGALEGFDGGSKSLNPILEWIQPSKRDDAKKALDITSALPGSSGLKIKFNVSNFDVTKVEESGDKAQVHVKGNGSVCVQGTVAGQNLNTCQAQGLASNNKDSVQAVKVDGKWYVGDINGGSSGSSSSGSSRSSAETGGGGSTSASSTSSGG